jgi:biotin carboxylase
VAGDNTKHRILLLLPTRTYRAKDFLEAARRLGVEVTVASEESSAMEKLQPGGLLTLDFHNPASAAQRASAFHRRIPFHAVVPVDEVTAVVAAAVARAVGLVYNPPEAAAAAGLKHKMREMLAGAGVAAPGFELVSVDDLPAEPAKRVRYPCVLKPVFLSGSRGVIRANDEEEFVTAFHRLKTILEDPDVARRGGSMSRTFLVEDYISGKEVALEGVLRRGELRVLALFDKPDPLEGPFFEETLYVTPSRLSDPLQSKIASCAARATKALGLREGPVHAELRVNDTGVYVIEVAGRSIGGLCSRALRFGLGISLEELLIRHALELDVEGLTRERLAAGVMMIPIPKAGMLREIRGVESAKAVKAIDDVAITAHLGKTLVPLPEGSTYLGFIFARAETADVVESALREAHSRIEFVI